jgi:hypothetical protein
MTIRMKTNSPHSGTTWWQTGRLPNRSAVAAFQCLELCLNLPVVGNLARSTMTRKFQGKLFEGRFDYLLVPGLDAVNEQDALEMIELMLDDSC